MRVFETEGARKGGREGSITSIDTFTIPEAPDPAFAVGFGDLSVREVALNPDPRKKLAYVSCYAGGFRVLKYGPQGLQPGRCLHRRGRQQLLGRRVPQDR